MTDEEIAAIEARANAATPGKWEALRVRVGWWWFTSKTILIHNLGSRPSNDWPEHWLAELAVRWPNPQAEADAEFIAHARSDIPALIAEIRRLQALLRPPER